MLTAPLLLASECCVRPPHQTSPCCLSPFTQNAMEPSFCVYLGLQVHLLWSNSQLRQSSSQMLNYYWMNLLTKLCLGMLVLIFNLDLVLCLLSSIRRCNCKIYRYNTTNGICRVCASVCDRKTSISLMLASESQLNLRLSVLNMHLV